MNFWNNLSLQLKLQLTIVLFMVITLIFGQLWIQHRFEEQAIKQAKTTILDEADNIANALTTMMLTGVISERKIYLDQLTHHDNIKAIHIARNEKVIEQYGKGVDDESEMDALEKKVVATKEPVFEEILEDGQRYLRGIIPVIASEDQMGKNCLECHDVPSGYVNGTISVTISLAESDAEILEIEKLLWIGQIGWQALLFVIILFIMQMLLTKPIKRVKETIEAVAQNKDLTLKIDYSYNDELGEIATQMNHLIQELQHDFEKIAQGANQVSGYSTRIKESSSHINERSEQQGSKLSDVVASVEEISRTTQMVASNTAEVASLSENASQAAVEGGEIIRQSIEGISHIRDTVISIATTIQSLQERSQQIGDITTVIDDIAEQTNLLALNAAIEAARAGEQGRGFAVVADEVRKLAERTSKATQEITQRISAIQTETAKAADGMTKGQEEVENGVALAEQAGNSLKSIVDLVEDVSSKLSNIAISMDEQKGAVEEIASNASEVASHASDNAKDIEEANKIAEELEEISNNLHSLINSFKF